MTNTVQPDLDNLHLESGKHPSRETGVCVMEAVAWYAGENHSDMPACVSPLLRSFDADAAADAAAAGKLTYAQRNKIYDQVYTTVRDKLRLAIDTDDEYADVRQLIAEQNDAAIGLYDRLIHVNTLAGVQ